MREKVIAEHLVAVRLAAKDMLDQIYDSDNLGPTLEHLRDMLSAVGGLGVPESVIAETLGAVLLETIEGNVR